MERAGGTDDCLGSQGVSSHVVVDKCKERDYLLVVSIHVSGELDDLRKLMRGFILRGRRRVRMRKERDPRWRAIAAAIWGAGVTAAIYDAGQRYRDELNARGALAARPGRGRGRPGRHHARDRQHDSLLDWNRRKR